MVRIFLMTGMAAFLATALCGCMTTSFAPTAADVQAYAIKSVAISGVAPQAVSELISSDLVSAIRTTLPKPGAQPVQMAVSISGFSGGAVASGYKAGADVTVTLKPVAGGKVVQTASFHEDAASGDEARASRQLAAAIAARVRRNFDLPASAGVSASANAARRDNGETKKPALSKQIEAKQADADADAAKTDPALSNDALNTLMKAAAETSAPTKDETKTGSVPGQAVALPDAACTGESLASCPQGSLLSGDFSLRK